jgi:hypothetical protein
MNTTSKKPSPPALTTSWCPPQGEGSYLLFYFTNSSIAVIAASKFAMLVAKEMRA